MQAQLTILQMTRLKMCVSDSAARYQQTADQCGSEGPRAQWNKEAADARQLLALLDDALFISVEPMPPPPSSAHDAAASPQAAPYLEASPTGSPSPSPRALHLANSLTAKSLRMFAASHPGQILVLDSRCNTILRSRGETEPLASLDLLAAARIVYQQKGYKPHLPLLSPALRGCPESPAAPHAALAGSAAPIPHPTSVSSLQQSSTHDDASRSDINHEAQHIARPPLIVTVDACTSVEQAQIVLAGSTKAGRRNASRYLRVSMHDLPEEIIRRVRARLLEPV